MCVVEMRSPLSTRSIHILAEQGFAMVGHPRSWLPMIGARRFFWAPSCLNLPHESEPVKRQSHRFMETHARFLAVAH
jgi:hypothetical protein